MKIAIIHNQFTRSGGMESYMLTLIRGFLAQGDEVHLHVYERDPALAHAFPTVTLQHHHLSLLPRRWRKYVFLRRYNRQFDRTEYDLSLSLTRTGCPDIAICGGVHPAAMASRRNRLSLRGLHDRLEIFFEQTMFARVRHIVAHSQLLRRNIHDHYQVDPGKVHVVYPPVDTERFRPLSQNRQNKIRRELGISPERITLLFPSLGHRRKGLQELLKAFALLPHERFELLVAGRPLRTKHRGNIRFLGYVDDLSPVYGAVDYTILPSRYEPFGLVVAESLQCGTPVVVSDQVGAAELLSPETGIILPDIQPETIAATLRDLDKPQHPAVMPDFATRTGLTITDHINALKHLV